MKRLHVHINVKDLAAAQRFYTAMLGTEPTVEKGDYAKWMLEDPRVNLAISTRANGAAGVDHLGIQAESGAELEELYSGLADASYTMLDEPGANCCYAHSDKHWAVDPSGLVWEMFHSMGEIATYGEDRVDAHSIGAPPKARACCDTASGASDAR